MAALNWAIEQVANCFDNCNRDPEPGSIWAQQIQESEHAYRVLDDHKTTLIHGKSFAAALVHGGLDYLKGATYTMLQTGSRLRWSSLALIRSLIEASAQCLWLMDTSLDVHQRLKHINQHLVRTTDEMVRMLPDPQAPSDTLIQIDPKARAVALETRDKALAWARAQGWKCSNGKDITLYRWKQEVPGYKESVERAAVAKPSHGGSLYSVLSATAHCQPGMIMLSLNEEPDVVLERTSKLLRMGVDFYVRALHEYAEVMGWDDHDVSGWFTPICAILEDLSSGQDEESSIDSLQVKLCSECPDYAQSYMHRLALASHLNQCWNHHLRRRDAESEESPERLRIATDFVRGAQEKWRSGQIGREQVAFEETRLGTRHMEALIKEGVDPSEVMFSMASMWAVLTAPGYLANPDTLLQWAITFDDGTSSVPFGN